MSRVLLWSLVVAPLVVPGCVHSPVLWSPDGRWLAYTVATRPVEEVLRPGWIFQDQRPELFGSDDPSAGVEGPEDLRYRLWVTRAEDGAAVLLEESAGPLTSPGWDPEGKALAFGRLVPLPDGRQRYEVVSRGRSGRQHVLYEKVVASFGAEMAGLPGLAVAWSPDGRHIAAPLPSPMGLILLRADTGRTVQVIEGAYFPAWSPDGARLAFYRGTEPRQAALEILEIDPGASKILAEFELPSQPPIWDRDGRSLLFLQGRIDRERERQFELIRVSIDSGAVTVVKPVGHSVSPGEEFLGASWTFDHDHLEQYYTLSVEGRDAAISHHLGRNPLNYFHPLDGPTPLGALAISPDGKFLAMRLGPPNLLSPPALYNLSTQKLELLAPDDATRAEWLAILIESARGLIATRLPPPIWEGTPAERPTMLPLPGEITEGAPGAQRLQEVARLGLLLCEPTAEDEALARLLPEARLLFQYLQMDYKAALASLEELEPTLDGADTRLRLLGLRAQIDLALGQFGRAAPTIDYLLQVQAPTRARVEPVGDGGLRIVEEASARVPWPEYLAHHARRRTERPLPGAESPWLQTDPKTLEEIERLLNPQLVEPPEPPPEPPRIRPGRIRFPEG
ncbi:hypothetical protein BH23PLA1_BH23PLA1_20370 [soil metagenome]